MIKNQPIIKYALLNSLLTAFYVTSLVTLVWAGPTIFGDVDNALIPMGMLLLFVFSALVTSGLILGRPVMWYIDGKKKEALVLLGYTALFLFIIMIAIFITSFLVSKI